jgi:hypothetical protein
MITHSNSTTTGVRDVLPALTDRGGDPANTSKKHVECRDCGSNLTTDTDRCPHCGGGIAAYDPS